MTPEHKKKTKNLLGGYEIGSQSSKIDPVEGKLSEKTASTDKQKHSDGAYLPGPKLRAESGGFAA